MKPNIKFNNLVLNSFPCDISIDKKVCSCDVIKDKLCYIKRTVQTFFTKNRLEGNINFIITKLVEISLLSYGILKSKS